MTASIWEAGATGLPLVLGRTPFTEELFGDDDQVELFGSEALYAIPGAGFRDGVDLAPPVAEALGRLRPRPGRTTEHRFTWEPLRSDLLDFYRRLP